MDDVNFFPKCDYNSNTYYRPNYVSEEEPAFVSSTNEFFNQLKFDYLQARIFVRTMNTVYTKAISDKKDGGTNGVGWEDLFIDGLEENLNIPYQELKSFLRLSKLDMRTNSGYKTFLDIIMKNADDLIIN